MSIKIRAGQIWTDSVAYVALFTGAGLSIAGNVANVVRTRGVQVDTLDVVLAVAFPVLVILMVEVFVSSRWRGLSWPMQVLRWLGTVSIGAVAMRVSWVHLNELMTSRGQSADVATLGPLAIDFLAIMATALILAGRGRPVVQDMPAPILDTPRDVSVSEADEILERWVETAPLQDGDVIHTESNASMWARLEADLASAHGPTLPVPVSPAPSASNMVKPESVPADAADLIMAWADADPAERPTPGQVDALVAAEMNVTTRTARRWRSTLLGAGFPS